MTEYQIDSFSLRQWSSRTLPSPGVALAGIYLFEEDQYRGDIYFYADGTDLKRPNHDDITGRIHLHCSIAQYAITLDMLRNESSVVLYFNSRTDAGLRSGRDPFAVEDPITS